MLGISSITRFSEDVRIIAQLARPRSREGTLQERLESFYQGQADAYDNFRERLLPARKELVERLVPHGFSGVWVDVGGGTGRTIEYVQQRIDAQSRVIVLDLCPALLEKAKERIEKENWRFAEAVCGDINDVPHLFGQADLVTFSYSLTMIPDWRQALINVEKILKPEGRLGIVDFTCDSQDSPPLSRLRGAFWKKWFEHDGVYLSESHLVEAERRFHKEYAEIRTTPLPYIPGARVPYYLFFGRSKLRESLEC
jgi:S-adenosylmethionine-diacylgycerolhomoserine-N-methlytransferase